MAAAALGCRRCCGHSHTGYTALRLVGAAYLVALGVHAGDGARAGAGGEAWWCAGGRLRAGLVTNLLNPKIGVFFVTLLPGFVPAGAPVDSTSLLLGVIFVLEGALYFVALVLLAERVAGWLHRPGVRRRLDRLAGVVLVGFGVRLATES